VAHKRTKLDIGISRGRGKADAEMAHLIDKYLERHPKALAEDGALDLEAILDWALASRIYRPPPPMDPKAQLRRRVRRHFGHRYRTTRSGRQIRALIAVPREVVTPDGIETSFRYFPILETEPNIIESGLRLRHGWTFRRVQQIQNDLLGYNEDNIFGATIKQFSFNFDAMLDRAAMPTSYPKAAPEGIDDEDDRVDGENDEDDDR
jgi:hypothetical protein